MKSNSYRDSPGGSVGKNPPASAEDMDLILVRENTTCPGATELSVATTEPVFQSSGDTTTEARHPRGHAPQQEEPLQQEA